MQITYYLPTYLPVERIFHPAVQASSAIEEELASDGR